MLDTIQDIVNLSLVRMKSHFPKLLKIQRGNAKNQKKWTEIVARGQTCTEKVSTQYLQEQATNKRRECASG